MKDLRTLTYILFLVQQNEQKIPNLNHTEHHESNMQ